jgi:hypothetical protein
MGKDQRESGGAPWLKTMLVQCAWAASRKKDSYYKAQFNRLRSKRGPKKAICAVAASMLTAIYHMLKDGTEHHVWMAPDSQGLFRVCGAQVACGHVSGL